MSSSTPAVVVFDLGNVLIAWDRGLGYPLHAFGGDAAARTFFLTQVCTQKWIDQLDAGADFKDVAPALVEKYPAFRDQIMDYPRAWDHMFPGPIDGSVAILRQLKENGTRLYALSNWSAELFPRAETRFPFLSLFDGKIISGRVGLIKPDPAIYDLLFQTYDFRPEQALFIDDRPENIAAGNALGMPGHVFKTPEILREDLQKRALL